MKNNKVEIKNIFPNLIATKKLDLSKLNVTGKNFKNAFESGIKTSSHLNTSLDVKSMNYLNIQVYDLLSYLMKPYCKNFVFNIQGMWMNKYSKNDYQQTHIHPSDFSFIIYYDVVKSYTVCNSPVKNLIDCCFNDFFNKDFEPNLKKGDIIIFPSYLEHWVRPNSSGMTIAGNIKILNVKN